MLADGRTLPQPHRLSYPINRPGIGSDKSVCIEVGPHNGAIQGCSHWTPITRNAWRALAEVSATPVFPH